MVESQGILELALSGLIVVGVGIYLVGKVRSGRGIGVMDVTLGMCGLFFGLGPWGAFIYGGGRLPEVEGDILMWTYGGIYLFIMGVYIGGRLSARKTAAGEETEDADEAGLMAAVQRVDWASTKVMGGCYGLVWGMRLLLGVKYGMFFSGTSSLERVTAVPYPVTVANMLLQVAAWGCLLYGCIIIWRGRSKQGLPWVILVMEILWAFVKGRRPIFSIVIFSIVVFLAHRHRLKLRHGLGLILTGAVLLGWIYPLFMTIRSEYAYSDPYGTALGRFVETAQEAIPQQDQEETYDNLESHYRENMAQRFIATIRFNGNILEGQRNHPLMWGEAMWSTFVWNVPSILYPGKLSMQAPEQLIQDYYDLSYEDAASSWPGYGCADFGVLGAGLAGVLMGLVMGLLENRIRGLMERYPFVGLCLAGGLVNIAVTVESSPNKLWGFIRSMIIIYVMARVVSELIPRKRYEHNIAQDDMEEMAQSGRVHEA